MSLGAKNIYLIGHRGVGKSTVAPLAAELLSRPWVDLDSEIERIAKASISRIFAENGETVFRDFESQALTAVAQSSGNVVATGGGVVLRDENRQLLSAGICIWMKASPKTINARLAESGRPPLTTMSLEVETEALLKVREPLYRSLAETVLEVDDSTPSVIAERIAERFRQT